MIRGLGINCDDEVIDGRLDRLDAELRQAADVGLDAYEFSSDAANVICGGSIVRPELDAVKRILERYPLRYTVHPPCSLRLTERTGLHRQVFLSCLDMTAHIGADVMVYHSAQMALRPADQDTGPLPSSAELQAMWQDETEALVEMAREAAKRNIIIAVENRDPHLWELAALRRYGKDERDLTTYHAGMRLDLLAKQVRDVASANVGICLDVGHAFLAAPYWDGVDYLTAVRQAAPWIKHVHFHDNFGRIDDEPESMRERATFGQADNHMPPGWGRIPLADVLATLHQAGYSGWLLTEIDGRYRHLLPDIADHLRQLTREYMVPPST